MAHISGFFFILVGLAVSGFSFWMNFQTGTRKLLLFGIIGSIMLIWGTIKVLWQWNSNKESPSSIKPKQNNRPIHKENKNSISVTDKTRQEYLKSIPKTHNVQGKCPICGGRLFRGATRCHVCASEFQRPYGY